MREKNIMRLFYKEKMVTDKATIKVEKEDEREAP